MYLVRVTSECYRCKGEFHHYYIKVDGFQQWIHGFTTCSEYNYFVVVTMFLTLLHLVDVLGRDFFHILIDEGAQARKPKSIAPLCLANGQTKILLIASDEQQVNFRSTDIVILC